MSAKMWVSGVLFGAVLFTGAAANGGNRERCLDRRDHERAGLDRDIEQHGYHSRQANHDRERLADSREDCRVYFRNDGDRDNWRRDKDRDRDRDRDYDRDRDRRDDN